MSELRDQKKRIRDRFRAIRSAIDPLVKQKNDGEICKRFRGLASYRYADTVMFYAPLPDEVDIMPLARDALASGKRVAFPLCGAENSMTYHLITDLSQLVPGNYGIFEPTPDLPIFFPSSTQQNILCLVPAIVFDLKGYRIGYGKGYYDRYLYDFSGIKAGVGYKDCVVDRLPRGKYDTAVDFLVTEKGVITTNAH